MLFLKIWNMEKSKKKMNQNFHVCLSKYKPYQIVSLISS